MERTVSGVLYIISAASGTGKTTLVRQLIACEADIVPSISHTTRPPRSAERDGVDYWFVNEREFQTLVRAHAFLEYAKVFDHHYGTSRDWVNRQLAEGKDVVLEIDWQGAQQVRHQHEHTVSVFILPPSRQVLEQRLRSRNQDSAVTVTRRMRDATEQMLHYFEFDYLLINDDLHTTLCELRHIVQCGRLRCARQMTRHQEMLARLLESP